MTEQEFTDAARGYEVPEWSIRDGDYSALPMLQLQPLGDSRIAAFASEIATEWLPSIIGPDIAARISQTPLSLCKLSEAENASSGQTLIEFQMMGAIGGYISGSNAIIIPPAVLSFSEADARYVLLHEELHYASWFGGGREIRWRDETGSAFCQGDPIVWSMREGLTELCAQQIIREMGFEPGRIGYAAETITCYYLEQLLGEGGRDVLRSAYMSGDFTEVRRRLDSALGPGAFDALFVKADGAQALSFLIGRMDERGIDYSDWDASPIVAAARAKLEGVR